MKVYETGNIRNVVVMGHGGCGKTALLSYCPEPVLQLGWER